jgi:luciferase family oxidoreductase group 1
MLPNHAPLQVVERYRTLEALFPGRIDLGLGRAPGTDPFTSRALRRRSGAEVNEQLRELLAFERGGFEEGHPYADILATPVDVPLPPIWMLGSSTGGAQLAGEMGVGYAFAGHFALESAAMACALYRESFRPSVQLAAPRAILAVSAICGETDEHARELASVVGLSFLRMAQAKVMRVPSIAEALAYPYTDDERAMVEQILRGHVYGSAETVRARLERLARRTGAAEVMVSTMLAEPDERVRSYERIARAFGLG